MMADLSAARESQMRRKLMAQATMAEVEQAEFRRVLEVNREKQMQDMSQVNRHDSCAIVHEAGALYSFCRTCSHMCAGLVACRVCLPVLCCVQAL
jgi:hypothetical protein